MKNAVFTNMRGCEISTTEARKLVRAGESVDVPDVRSAGGYRGVLRLLGFRKVEVEDWTSSAGDWCFKIQGGRFCWQENRWPIGGYRYTIGKAYAEDPLRTK